MSNIRIFAPQDVEAVSELNRIAFPEEPTPPSEFYIETFLDNPWFDESIPPLVHVENDGRVTGFLGVVPRFVDYGDIKGSAAIVCQFMVDPEFRSSMAGLRLLKNHFTGPQLISIADSANESGRKIWAALGGEIIPSYSFSWRRAIRKRPVTRLSKRLGRWKGLGLIGKAALPAAGFIDGAIDSLIYQPRRKFGSTELICKQVQVTDIGGLVDKFPGNLMTFHYPESTTTLLLRQARPLYGASETVHLKAVFDVNENLLGLFTYFFGASRDVHVLHFFSNSDRVKDVFDCFSHSMDKEGVISIHGRMDPKLAISMEQVDNLSYTHRKLSCVVYSRNQVLLSAIRRGDFVLSALECEWSCNYRA